MFIEVAPLVGFIIKLFFSLCMCYVIIQQQSVRTTTSTVITFIITFVVAWWVMGIALDSA